MADISEQVASLPSRTQARVLQEGEVLDRHEMKHIAMSAGASNVSVTKTPALEVPKPAKQL